MTEKQCTCPNKAMHDLTLMEEYESELAQLRIENLRLREALEKTIGAIKHCIYEAGGVCEHEAGICLCKEFSALSEAREALNATPANDEWLDKLVMERLGNPVRWIDPIYGDVSVANRPAWEPLYRLTSGKEGK